MFCFLKSKQNHPNYTIYVTWLIRAYIFDSQQDSGKASQSSLSLFHFLTYTCPPNSLHLRLIVERKLWAVHLSLSFHYFPCKELQAQRNKVSEKERDRPLIIHVPQNTIAFSPNLSKFWHLGAASGPFTLWCGLHCFEPHSHTPSPGSSESHSHGSIINTPGEWGGSRQTQRKPMLSVCPLTTCLLGLSTEHHLQNTSSNMKVLRVLGLQSMEPSLWSLSVQSRCAFTSCTFLKPALALKKKKQKKAKLSKDLIKLKH